MAIGRGIEYKPILKRSDIFIIMGKEMISESQISKFSTSEWQFDEMGSLCD